MTSSLRPIGIFDSGVGGLTVLRALRALLPHEDLVYLGDTARVPYGTKGPDTVRAYATHVADRLVAERCKAIVIACNTASAFAADALRSHLPHLPIVDVISPVVAAVARDPSIHHVGVLGTRGTVASQAYPRALHELRPDLRVTQQACPLLVPLAEEGWLDGPITESIVATYLEPLTSLDPPRSLILGCTHYPLLEPVLQRVARRMLRSDVHVVDSAHATALATRTTLARVGLLRDDTGRPGQERFLATDVPESVTRVAELFLGRPVAHVEHVDLGPLVST